MSKARWKAGLFLGAAVGCLCALTTTVNAKISITRDAYGVPDIQATTNREMFFGYGYAMARDRIIQITKLKLLSSGIAPINPVKPEEQQKVQSVYGNYYLKEYPNLDANIAKEIQELRSSRLPMDRLAIDALDCIADGINLFLSEIQIPKSAKQDFRSDCNERKNTKSRGQEFSFGEALAPKEIKYINDYFTLEDKNPVFRWTAGDILKIFQNRVMDEFSNRNEEINNLAFLRILEKANLQDPDRARRIFNSFKWVADPDAITEIPVAGITQDAASDIMNDYRYRLHSGFLERGSNSSCPSYSTPEAFSAKASADIHLKLAHLEGYPQNASYFWATAGGYNKAGVKSVMMNGPQTGTFDPGVFYPFKMQSGEGFRYAGTSFSGTLTTFNGYNGALASGFTAGNSDVSDIFCIKVKAHGEGYVSTAGDLTLVRNIKVPGALYVAGKDWPVVFMERGPQGNEVAYIKRVAWQGTTASSFKSFLAASQAKTTEDWNRALDTVGTNFNMVAAASDGKVSIRLTGAIPSRVGTKDNPEQLLTTLNGSPSRYLWEQDIRLPVPRSPKEGWHDGPPEFYKLGYTLSNGYVQSWNHKPYMLMPDSDLYYDSWYKWDRADIISRELEAGASKWSLEKAKTFVAKLSRVDINYNRFRQFLVELLKEKSLSSDDRQKLTTILSWNGNRGSNVPGAKLSNCSKKPLAIHPGEPIFMEWYQNLANQFEMIITGGKEPLKSAWGAAYAKLKQPKLNFSDKPQKATFDTSQNVYIFGKMILVNLHYAFGTNPSYDPNGWNFLRDMPAASEGDGDQAATKIEALRVMSKALSDIKIDELKSCPSRHGFSNRLSTGVTMTSREQTTVPYYRSRGAQNHGVEFSNDGVKGENIAAPGVREYQNVQSRHTVDQLPLFDKDQFRDMGPLVFPESSAKKIRSKL